MKNNKFLYWSLIIAFFVLYAFVAFVSTLHAVSFFQLTNVMWMAVLLAVAYEIGQASVLFAILTSDNNKRLLPWAMMILLTSVQIVGNVYASFKFMDSSGSMDWTYWQRSILFWLEVDGPEMFKVIISWITGALLPVVALGMTALVAENLKLKDEQDNKSTNENELKPIEPLINPPVNQPGEFPEDEILKPNLETTNSNIKHTNENITKKEEIETVNDSIIEDKINIDDHYLSNDEELEDFLNEKEKKESDKKEEKIEKLVEKLLNDENIGKKDDKEKIDDEIVKEENIVEEDNKEDKVIRAFKRKIFNIPLIDPALFGNKNKKPVDNPRGWHLKEKHVDINGDVYRFGEFQDNLKTDLDSAPPKKE